MVPADQLGGGTGPQRRGSGLGRRRGRGEGAVDDADALRSAEGKWFAASRYQRRARVTAVTPLTTTGTVRVSFEVVDGQPFHFLPGQFVGIEGFFEGFGWRRSPYCILSTPTGEPVFDLLVRVVVEGPLSGWLAGKEPGEEVAFRGPTGRSIVPPDDDSAVVMFATGSGVAPFFSLARFLVANRYAAPIRLWWGLRLEADICLTEELDHLGVESPHFDYAVSLSQPGPDWTGLRGRLGQSVPPLLSTLGDSRFYLSGNGAMLEEMATALSHRGVDRKFIHKEPYFNGSHDPRPEVVAAISDRFVATDLASAYVRRTSGSPAALDLDVDALRSGLTGGGERLGVTELFEMMPALLRPPEPGDGTPPGTEPPGDGTPPGTEPPGDGTPPDGQKAAD